MSNWLNLFCILIVCLFVWFFVYIKIRNCYLSMHRQHVSGWSIFIFIKLINQCVERHLMLETSSIKSCDARFYKKSVKMSAIKQNGFIEVFGISIVVDRLYRHKQVIYNFNMCVDLYLFSIVIKSFYYHEKEWAFFLNVQTGLPWH